MKTMVEIEQEPLNADVQTLKVLVLERWEKEWGPAWKTMGPDALEIYAGLVYIAIMEGVTRAIPDDEAKCILDGALTFICTYRIHLGEFAKANKILEKQYSKVELPTSDLYAHAFANCIRVFLTEMRLGIEMHYQLAFHVGAFWGDLPFELQPKYENLDYIKRDELILERGIGLAKGSEKQRVNNGTLGRL